MACGLPFVASDLPTTAMFTNDFGVADLVPPGDPEAFATALCSLLGDPERQERMSRNGPPVAREHYNWEVESRKLTDLCESLIGPPS
jgi:glycosyltransferase involved in cell wall biosynthesis